MRRATLVLILLAVVLAGCGGGHHPSMHAPTSAAARRIPPPDTSNDPVFHAVQATARRSVRRAVPPPQHPPPFLVLPPHSRVRRPAAAPRHARPKPLKKPGVIIGAFAPRAGGFVGQPVLGQVLHSDTGTWSGSPTSFAYQWMRCDANAQNCVPIGAAVSTYTVIQADVGHTIEVTVAASNAGGTASQTSLPTQVVLAVPLNTSVPVITGTGVQGQVLTTTAGVWSNGSPTFTYQWKRCDSLGNTCSNIGSATATTYTLTLTDVGHTLRSVVTATNGSGVGAPATSQPSGVITGTGGTTYYVDNQTGNDGNNGTSPATAWASVAHAQAHALSGDQSILFEGGETFSGQLDGNGSGTAGHPTTYGSYGTGKAILTDGSTTVIYPTGESYVTFQNLIVDGGVGGGTDYDCVGDFSGAAATHITFDGVEVRNCTYGFDLGRAADSNWTIQNSYVHNTQESGIVIGGPAHTFGNANSIIQNNQIEHTGTDDPSPITGVGSDSHGIYDNAYGLQVLNNDIGDYQTTGISVRFGGALIQGNTIHDAHRTDGAGDACVAYWSEDLTSADGAFTSTMRYNRCWDTQYGVNLAGANQYGGNPGPDNWLIYDNTFDAAGGGASHSIQDGVAIQSTMGSTVIGIQNNIFKGWTAGIVKNHTPATYTENHNDFYLSGSSPGGTGDITGNPLLSASPVFLPGTGSPAANAGTATVQGSPTFTNLCNNAILDYCGSAPDMGAVETGVATGGGNPVNTTLPLVSGTAQEGQALTATQGTWTGATFPYLYQWQACDAALSCTNVTGQTGSSYNPLAATEINHTVRVAVTAGNSLGSTTAYSQVTALVAPAGGTQSAPALPVVGSASTVCTKYASPAGGGSGTIGSPWSLATLMTSLTAGQVGCLEAGTYGSSASYWTFSNGAGITVTAQPGVAATIDGDIDVEANGVTISYINSDLNNLGAPRGSDATSRGCTTNGAYALQINANNVTIANDNISQSDVAIANRGVGIGAGWAAAGNGTAANTGIVIRNNQIHDVGGCVFFDHVIYDDKTNGTQITGNWIYNDLHGAGIQAYPLTANENVSGNIINNVAVGVIVGGGVSNVGNSYTHNVFSNITLPDFGAVAIFADSGGTSGSSATSNDLFNVTGGIGGGSGIAVSGTQSVDPQYINAAAADFRAQNPLVASYGLWNGGGGSSSSFSSTSLMGKPTVGATISSSGFSANRNRAACYTAGKSGIVNRLSIYLASGTTAGSQALEGAMYASASGAPTTRLAVSTPITFTSSQPPGWYDLTLTTPVTITSGTTYCISILSGTTDAVANPATDAGATRYFRNDPFASGPLDPFAADSTDTTEMSFDAIIP